MRSPFIEEFYRAELYSLIQENAKKIPKELYLIDTNLKNSTTKDDFIKTHEKLFNAKFVQGWTDLAHYYESNKNFH